MESENLASVRVVSSLFFDMYFLASKSYSRRLLSLLGVPARLASFSGRFSMSERSRFKKKGSHLGSRFP